jgi:hypothetical protein
MRDAQKEVMVDERHLEGVAKRGAGFITGPISSGQRFAATTATPTVI